MPRVYCPFTAADLDALTGAGALPAQAFAVTNDIRALAPDGDEELYEHLATQLAAASSVTARVLVAALDVPAARVRPASAGQGNVGRVVIDGPVTTRDVVCYLLGDAGEKATPEADLELSWYDAGERDDVRALM